MNQKALNLNFMSKQYLIESKELKEVTKFMSLRCKIIIWTIVLLSFIALGFYLYYFVFNK